MQLFRGPGLMPVECRPMPTMRYGARRPRGGSAQVRGAVPPGLPVDETDAADEFVPWVDQVFEEYFFE